MANSPLAWVRVSEISISAYPVVGLMRTQRTARMPVALMIRSMGRNDQFHATSRGSW
jgi:hypothetical protein